MAHLLVDQLRFARLEFQRCLEGVSTEDALKRLEPMNCISWIVGHMADQENRYWVFLAQGKKLAPELRNLVGFGKPPSTPPWAEMWTAWQEVTNAADPYLDTLTPAILEESLVWRDAPLPESIGTLLQRNIFHYWYHTGEASAIRQMLGHPNVPEFVGDISRAAYRRES
jgi:hypothetical protein